MLQQRRSRRERCKKKGKMEVRGRASERNEQGQSRPLAEGRLSHASSNSSSLVDVEPHQSNSHGSLSRSVGLSSISIKTKQRVSLLKHVPSFLPSLLLPPPSNPRHDSPLPSDLRKRRLEPETYSDLGQRWDGSTVGLCSWCRLDESIGGGSRRNVCSFVNPGVEVS